jgi:mRNA interferase MazF
VNQGEIRWCQFRGPARGRPAVVLTRNNSIQGLNAVTVAPITTRLLGIRSRVRLGEEDGLREPSEVNTHNLQTLPKGMVGQWIATLSNERMRQITEAIAYALGFDRYEGD